MTVKITSESFEPWRELNRYEGASAGKSGKVGAASVFVGTMRNFNDGASVRTMTLVHYPGMTEKQLEKIVEEVKVRWTIADALILHRVGEIRPDETIVLTAVWASHRGDAFDACRYLVEALKSRAPFWKKELLESGQARWVEKNTDGYQGSIS